jgi:hypothetical protein
MYLACCSTAEMDSGFYYAAEAIKTFVNQRYAVVRGIARPVIGLLASKLSRRWLRSILTAAAYGRRPAQDSSANGIGGNSAYGDTDRARKISIPVTSLVAGLGITGLIIGFALRDTLNFAAVYFVDLQTVSSRRAD